MFPVDQHGIASHLSAVKAGVGVSALPTTLGDAEDTLACCVRYLNLHGAGICCRIQSCKTLRVGDLSEYSLDDLSTLIDEAAKLRAEKVEARKQELRSELETKRQEVRAELAKLGGPSKRRLA